MLFSLCRNPAVSSTRGGFLSCRPWHDRNRNNYWDTGVYLSYWGPRLQELSTSFLRTGVGRATRLIFHICGATSPQCCIWSAYGHSLDCFGEYQIIHDLRSMDWLPWNWTRMSLAARTITRLTCSAYNRQADLYRRWVDTLNAPRDLNYVICRHHSGVSCDDIILLSGISIFALRKWLLSCFSQ